MPSSVTMDFNGKSTENIGKSTSEWSEDFIKRKAAETYVAGIIDMVNKTIAGMFCKIEARLQAAAITFDRMISRTPFDEPYEGERLEKDGKGGLRIRTFKHKPDNWYIKLSWCMSIGEQVVATSKSLMSSGCSFFDAGDENDIQCIYSVMVNFLSNKSLKEVSNDIKCIKLYNEDEGTGKYSALEYGNSKWKNGMINEGALALHGVDNKHSVQAPNGMFRLSMAQYKDAYAGERSVVDESQILAKVQQLSNKINTEELINRILAYTGKEKAQFITKEAMKLLTTMEYEIKFSDVLS